MTLALIPFLALILTACDGIELPRSSQSDLAVEDQGAATTVTRTEQSGTTARTPSELPEEQFKDEVGSIDASPGDRYALLIGNEAYPREVGPLTLPHEDVESVAAALLQSGFPEDNITIIKDADRGEMLRSIRVFKSALQNTEKKGVGFFYYSGHGGSSESGGNRENFLLPSNELITDASELRDNGVSVSNLLTDMAQTEARAVFVISDACRNTLPITSEKGGGADKGMVREPRRGGLFIAFATADGQTTKDDGLFARVLASELPIPNRGYYETFKAVQNRISQERDLAKQPYVMDGITGQFCFLSCAPSFKRDDIPAIESLDTEEAQAWKAALEPISIDAIASYLEGYPNGAYAEYAKLLVSLREVADEAVETIDEFSKELFVQDYFRDDFDSFNPVVLQVVEHLLSEKTGLGYSLQSNGFTEDLIFGDEILVGGNGTTNTVSIVQEVLVRSMSLWAQQNNSRVPFERFSTRDLVGSTIAGLRPWIYVWDIGTVIPEYGRRFGKGLQDAALIHGIGRRVRLDEAEPGDFVYFNRTSGIGAAGVMLDLLTDGNDPEGEIIGFRYFSSFANGNAGVGIRDGFFAEYCPTRGDRDPEDPGRDCGIIPSPDLLSITRLHSPTVWGSGDDVNLALEAVFTGTMTFEEIQRARYGETSSSE